MGLRFISWFLKRWCRASTLTILVARLAIEVMERSDCNTLYMTYNEHGYATSILARISTEQRHREEMEFADQPPELECCICTNVFVLKPNSSPSCPSCGSRDLKIANVPKR